MNSQAEDISPEHLADGDNERTTDRIVSIYMGEYAALRTELITFQGLEYQSIQFAFAAVVAMAALVLARPTSFQTSSLTDDWILFVAPPFWLLGCLYAYAQFKVMIAANYLHQHLRRKLTELVGSGAEVLNWEISRRCGLSHGNKLVSEMLSSLRWIFFLWPLVSLFRSAGTIQFLPKQQVILCVEIVLFVGLLFLGSYNQVWLHRSVLKEVNADLATQIDESCEGPLSSKT